MPVVTTRPRALAASAGRGPGKGPTTSARAAQILFASGFDLYHTLGMFRAPLLQLWYGMATGCFRPVTRVATAAEV